MIGRRFICSSAPMKIDTRSILPQSREDAALMAHMRARMAERRREREATD